MDNGADRWGELRKALKSAEGEEWYEALQGSDSMVGFLSGTWMPMWVMRLYAWWRFRGDEPFVDRVYDPVPTMASLDVPSVWIFGGEDSSMPTQWSIDQLEKLKAAGRPIEIEVFPDAEHGILASRRKTASGATSATRRATCSLQVDWLRLQAGLNPPSRRRAVARGGREREPRRAEGRATRRPGGRRRRVGIGRRVLLSRATRTPIVPPRLGPVAAVLHRAPPAATIATGVVEEPGASRIGAGLDASRVVVDEQVRRRPRDGPENVIERLAVCLDLPTERPTPTSDRPTFGSRSRARLTTSRSTFRTGVRWLQAVTFR